MGGGRGKYKQGVGEVDLLTSLSSDSFLIITGSSEDDTTFLEQVATWYVGVFGGGGGRVSERKEDGVFLRKFSKDLSFCVAASFEGMGFEVAEDGGVVGF